MNESYDNGFFIAPFAPDGDPQGIGFWEFAKLSPQWIDTCTTFLSSHGSSFRASWGQHLERIETKLTSDDGAGLGAFFVAGIPVLSTLYLTGKNKNDDNEVMEMFLESMRRTDIVKAFSQSATAFESIKSIADRPLAVAVIWESDGLSDDDRGIVRELSTHFAAAFFLLNESSSV